MDTLPDANGWFNVTEEIRGEFTTQAGVSPGSCEEEEPVLLGQRRLHTFVPDGITGSYEGRIHYTVYGGAFFWGARPCGSAVDCPAGLQIEMRYGFTVHYGRDRWNLVYTTANNGTFTDSSDGFSGDIRG